MLVSQKPANQAFIDTTAGDDKPKPVGWRSLIRARAARWTTFSRVAQLFHRESETWCTTTSTRMKHELWSELPRPPNEFVFGPVVQGTRQITKSMRVDSLHLKITVVTVSF